MREPIDLEQLAAEFADLPDLPDPHATQESRIDEQEILVALQAEVQRLSTAKVAEPEVTEAEVAQAEVAEAEAIDPFGIVAESPVPATAPVPETNPVPAPGSAVGLPIDQVRAWLGHVQEDLRRIEARLQRLEAEQIRLQEQHHIVAELLTSSTPV